MKTFALLLAFLLASCGGVKPPASPASSDSWIRKEEGKAIYIREEEFARVDGSRVRFIGMVHIASAGFYQEVSERCREADVVLTEGVSGRPDFGPWGLTLSYALGSYSRIAELGGATRQDFGFDPGTKARSGDCSLAEMTSESSWLGREATGAVVLPFALVFGETLYLCGRSDLELHRLVGQGDATRARYRELLLGGNEVKDDAESSPDSVIPGILDVRNRHLMDEVDKAIAASSQPPLICLPWGAAHGPGISKLLRQRGFFPVEQRWHRLCTLTADDNDDEASQFTLPWLFRCTHRKGVTEVAFLADSLDWRSSPEGWSLSLLWRQGFSCAAGKNQWQATLLPQLFGLPLGWERRPVKGGVKYGFLLIPWQNDAKEP